MERLPLFGHRILDLTTGWSGAYGTRLLADMGAEVIKVEALNDGDSLRASMGRSDSAGAMFNHVNRNKYGCALDLDRPEGRGLFLRLVALSDVVVEDFGAPVAAELGLSYEALRSARADVILVSLSTEGEGVTHGEPLAGVAAAAAVGLALWHRRRTGEGQQVEVAQWETMVSLMGEYVLGHSMNGRPPEPIGNRHSFMAPHGSYRCAGDDQRVAIAVKDDQQFAALCRVMGRPELAAEPRFADVVSRYHNQDELDGIVEEWTRQHSPEAVTESLQAVGVAAAPVLNAPALFDDPHLRARGFWESVSHPEAGTWDVDGVPWRLDRSPAHIRLPAPRFGEHNDYVLRGLLGLSEEDVRELVEAGVIRGEPGPDVRA